MVTASNFSPFIPSESALALSGLPDKAILMVNQSAKLAGNLVPHTQQTIRQHMAVINSYYSNLIEGNKIQPHEIRAAQQGDYSADTAKRDLQQESIAHVDVQAWIANQSFGLKQIYSSDFFLAVHEQFYQGIPENLWVMKNHKGDIESKVVPGQWREQMVDVGLHVAPEPEHVPDLMQQFCDVYYPDQFQGDRKYIAAMCAHHRLLWIHPFTDGNGRVARLFTDAVLKKLNLESYGVWCLSRGIARSSEQYKSLLALADSSRQGDLDGRGLLSEKRLIEFCHFMLDVAIDQIQYMSELLQLDSIHKRIESYIQARNDQRVPGMKEPVKKVAGLILYNAFLRGELERSLAYEVCGMPERSARRLLGQLKEEGLLSETSSKSPLRWEIPQHAEPWYFPNLASGVV